MSLESFDLTNWRDHPTRKKYSVFFFRSTEQGAYFESLLKEHDIWYEKHVEEEDVDRKVLFAVSKDHMRKVIHLNNLAIGKFRKPFIPMKVVRILIMLISFTVLAMAGIGWWLKQGV